VWNDTHAGDLRSAAHRAMGIGGGDSLGKMMSDARSIVEDIAKFLGKWGRGDTLDQAPPASTSRG
jgi:hypothetical protein